MDYRYKIGQKVRVRKDLSHYNLYYMKSGPGWNESRTCAMSSQVALAGEEVTIRDYFEANYLVKGSNWRWTDEMFEDSRKMCYCKSLL